MKVAIVYNEPQAGRPDSIDILDQLGMVQKALDELGHEHESFAISDDHDIVLRLSTKLKLFSPAIIFNLFEGLRDDPHYLPLVTSLFEFSGVPYTGSPFHALLKTTDKILAKTVLDANSLPTPGWHSYRGDIADLQNDPPWIVKPSWEDGSVGIHDSSVFLTREELIRRLPEIYRRQNQQPLLIEKFIDGREFNVPLLQREDGSVEVLPPSEILFEFWPDEKPRILNYRSKWEEESFEYENTQRTFEPEDAPVELMKALALKCWDCFDLRGYARVDLRMDLNGNAYIIEINANPCITPESGYMGAVREAGYDEKTMVARLLASGDCLSRPSDKKNNGNPRN